MDCGLTSQLDTLLLVEPKPPRDTVVWLVPWVVLPLATPHVVWLRLLLEPDDDEDRQLTGSPRLSMQFFSPGVSATAIAAPPVPNTSNLMAVDRLMAGLHDTGNAAGRRANHSSTTSRNSKRLVGGLRPACLIGKFTVHHKPAPAD